MPRITPVSWQVFECVLLAAGFRLVRQAGGHRIYTREGVIRPLVVPAHSKDLCVLIIQSNLKSAGISRDEYFCLLEKC